MGRIVRPNAEMLRLRDMLYAAGIEWHDDSNELFCRTNDADEDCERWALIRLVERAIERQPKESQQWHSPRRDALSDVERSHLFTGKEMEEMAKILTTFEGGIVNSLYPAIKVKRVNPDAQLPVKAHPSDAAYDLCAMEDVTLMPGEFKMVGSGLAFAIPVGWCGAVYPRSGLGCKGLVLKNTVGIIDSHYRGEVMLPLLNNNQTHVWEKIGKLLRIIGCVQLDKEPKGTIHVHKGDRVAQMRIELVPDTTLIEVDELDETDRNTGSFGSTGISGGERL